MVLVVTVYFEEKVNNIYVLYLFYGITTIAFLLHLILVINKQNDVYLEFIDELLVNVEKDEPLKSLSELKKMVKTKKKTADNEKKNS
jgi:hypothetical protein